VLEIVALSALTTFLLGVGNGAAGEIGKQLTLSTGALVRRTMGRETPLPVDPAGREALAGQVYARLGTMHSRRVSGRCLCGVARSSRLRCPAVDFRPLHEDSPTVRES
jgi:hypothetical protein